MEEFLQYGLSPSRILLPGAERDLSKWAVVACDQFTSQPDWWDRADEIVGDAPSTLRFIFPECRLSQGEPDAKRMHGVMRDYRKSVLTRAVDGFVLVQRQTTVGPRLGLVAALDLEKYDYAPGAKPLIRATEGTVVSRLPARMAIRGGAPLEAPHVMVLADDPGRTLIEPLYAKRDLLRPLYDFELMQGAGRVRGWAVERPEDFQALLGALRGLSEAADGFLFAVGDGNHSLAAARGCWMKKREHLSEAERARDPMRFALVEIENLMGDALQFEPIHRAVFGAEPGLLAHDFVMYCRERGMIVAPCAEGDAQFYMLEEPLRIENAVGPLALAVLQPFLDKWLIAHPDCSIDYIHGLDALMALPAARVRLTAMAKRDLFPAVRAGGALPRKTFSMGEAIDKRFYLECRALTEDE